MPYQGMNWGSGIASAAHTLEQGYRDRMEMDRQRAMDEATVANMNYDNAVKTAQVEAQYGPMSGEMVVPVTDLPVNRLDALKAGAAAGATFKQRNVVVSPQGVTPNVMTLSGPQGEPGQAPGMNLMAGIPGYGQQVLTGQAPTGEDASVAAQSAQYPPEIMEAVKMHGGRINEQGQILLPNYQARRLAEDKKNATSLEMLGARLGARPDQVTNAGRGYGGNGGPGGKTVANPDLQMAMREYASLSDQLIKGDVTADIFAANRMGMSVEAYRLYRTDRMKQLKSVIGQTPAQVSATGTRAPPAAPPAMPAPPPKMDDSRIQKMWGDYLAEHPKVNNNKANFDKFKKNVGG